MSDKTPVTTKCLKTKLLSKSKWNSKQKELSAKDKGNPTAVPSSPITKNFQISEANKEILNEVNALKKTFISYIDSIALKKFPEMIVKIREMKKDFSKKLEEISKNQETNVMIEIPEALAEKLKKFGSNEKTIEEWLQANPAFQCRQLSNKPTLISNCKLGTNKLILDIIEQIKPMLIDLDEDIDKLDCALRLIFPKMRDGEYLGIEILEELLNSMSSLQSNLSDAYSKFINYNVTRSEIVSDIFKLGHIEENRLKLNRFDKKYNLILQKSVNDIYYIYVVIFDLFKKNYNQIMEFKNLAINCDEDDDLIYSSLFL